MQKYFVFYETFFTFVTLNKIETNKTLQRQILNILKQ